MVVDFKGDGEAACYYPNALDPKLILRVRRFVILKFNGYELKGRNGKVLLDFDINDNGERVDWLQMMLEAYSNL